MILRRIKTHLKNENWFAVFIDFIIVVIGVFMGIQVQVYYESQSDQKKMRTYLGRLHEDISLSLSQTEHTRNFVSQNLEYLKVVLVSTKKCSVAEDQRDRFANGLFHIGKLIPEQFVDGTLTELRASGRLLLLDNPTLRNEINEMVREHEYLARVWPALQNRVHRDRDYIDSKIIYDIDRPLNGYSMIEWSELNFELNEVCKDREFLARLSGLYRAANINVAWLNRNLTNFKKVKLTLERELGIEPAS